ncbi:MAG TPA: DUF1116 domain-containing protein [Solirubrobacteraceae bacterium]|jgi:hypothetical protein|nr:DUF1116 domain-containing protein [Solirubrobacteraceae bacterium]
MSSVAAAQAGSAHEAALAALDQTVVHLAGVKVAAEVSDAVGPRSFLHAGPPIDTADLLGPMRAAAMGALVLEGEAADLDEAGAIIDGGGLELRPAHEVGGLSAAAGVISPRVPVVVARSTEGREAFAPLHEGNDMPLRYGAYGPETLERLRHLGSRTAPALDAAIQTSAPIELTALQAEGLRRGDECHNRNAATSAAIVLALAPALVRADPEFAARFLEEVAENNQFFLGFSMAAAKVIGDEAHDRAEPGIVTAIAANGRRVGLRVSGCGDRWFTTEAPLGQPRIFEPHTLADACPLMGDSFATEVMGLGALASSAAPALASFLGADPLDAVRKVAEMRRICAGESTRFLLPFERYRGTPIGIDVGAVFETGVAPLVNGGFAHRTPGAGMVGAGVVRLPLEPFAEARSYLRNADDKGDVTTWQ